MKQYIGYKAIEVASLTLAMTSTPNTLTYDSLKAFLLSFSAKQEISNPKGPSMSTPGKAKINEKVILIRDTNKLNIKCNGVSLSSLT